MHQRPRTHAPRTYDGTKANFIIIAKAICKQLCSRKAVAELLFFFELPAIYEKAPTSVAAYLLYGREHGFL